MGESVGRVSGPTGWTARAAGAVALRPAAYQSVAADSGANLQAGVVVVLSAAGAAAGEATLAPDDLAWQAVASLAHWGVWVPTTWWTGKALGGAASWAAVARALALAKAPGAFAALAVVPVVGGLLHAATIPWVLATGVAAARATLGLGFFRALFAVLPGLVAYWLALALLF